MSVKVFINGKLLPKEQAVVNVYDHGLLYGDGVFEGIRVYSKNVFLLKEHVERLYESAKAIRLEIPMTPDGHGQGGAGNGGGQRDRRRLRPAGRHARGGGPGARYPQDERSAGDRHRRHDHALPGRALRKGMAIITASTIRNHPGALSARIKSLNYLNNILAKIEGTDAGARKP